MIGARYILAEMGYSETLESSIKFPDHVEEPDREKLKVIAAELLMANLEAADLRQAELTSKTSPSDTEDPEYIYSRSPLPRAPPPLKALGPLDISETKLRSR